MAHTLLLADDSVTIQRVVELTFAGEDIRIVAVGNGQQAIDRLSDDPPDIVLADIGMPLLDGYAVASFVKNHDALRAVPVLLMVGAFDPVDEDRVQASGASGVLVKPFEPTLVISRVKELLGLGSHPAEKVDVAPAAPAAVSDAPAAAASPVSAPVSAPSAVADFEQDWLPQDSSERLRAKLAESPESSDVPPSPVEALWAKEAAVAAPPAPAPVPAAAPVPATSVADAFSALLAAEQGEPVAAPAAPVGEPAPSLDAIVEQVTTKVIERLGTDAVREHVDRIVLEVAERLVREEIARIRNAAAERRS